eukprot:jgi/Botrbrau1/20713/Bobra.0058s0042.1
MGGEGGAVQLNVEADSPARNYTPGFPGPDGNVTEDNRAFYLYGTAGIYSGEFPGNLITAERSNWLGYVSIGPQAHNSKEFEHHGGLQGDRVPIDSHCLPELHPLLDKVCVSKGIEEIYRRFVSSPGNTLSMQGQVHVAVRKLLAQYKERVTSITVTGHSLGAGVATLCAFDISASGLNRQCDSKKGLLVPVTCMTFSSPRVGNWAFADFFKVPKGPRHLRMLNSG